MTDKAVKNAKHVVLADFTYGSSHIPSYLAIYAKLLQQQKISVTIICHPSTVEKLLPLLNNQSLDKIPIFCTRWKSLVGFLLRILAKAEKSLRRPYSKTNNSLSESPLANWLILSIILRFAGIPQSAFVFFPLAYPLICKRTWIWKLISPNRWCAMILEPSSTHLLASSCLNDKSCKAIFTLTDAAAEVLRYNGIHRPILRMPDITETDTESPSERVQDILKEIRGKKAVLLIGALSSRKRILNLLKATAYLPDNYRTVIAGEFLPHSFSSFEYNEILTDLSSNSKTIFSPGHIKDERDLNSLIASCDILFLAYKDFKGSSNIQVKAAAFKRPVIASANCETGNRTEEFNIGVTVDDFSPEYLASKIQELITSPKSGCDFDGFVNKYGNMELAVHLISSRLD